MPSGFDLAHWIAKEFAVSKQTVSDWQEAFSVCLFETLQYKRLLAVFDGGKKADIHTVVYESMAALGPIQLALAYLYWTDSQEKKRRVKYTLHRPLFFDDNFPWQQLKLGNLSLAKV